MTTQILSSKIQKETRTDAGSGIVQVTARLPAALAGRIQNDVDGWNADHKLSPETKSDRMAYLLQYAYDAGSLNNFIDLMRAQYLEILAITPKQLAEGGATYNQQDTINYRLNDIDDKLDKVLRALSQG